MTSASSCSAASLVSAAAGPGHASRSGSAARRRHLILLVAALAACVAVMSSCARETDGPTLYGASASLGSLTETAQPLASLAVAAGSAASQPSVTVRGTIGKVCQSMGCWFYLTDATSMLLIDLDNGSRFTIPTDATGHDAIVRGRLEVDGGDRRIVATAAAIFPAEAR